MNISGIAKTAGVSVATVSRVLNNPDAVKEKTREKILKVIKECNYVPNAMARSLSTNTYSNIGVAFPDIQNHFFSSMLHGITQKATSFGYNVYFYDTDENVENEHRFLTTVQEQRFKGIIMTPISEQDKTSIQMISNLENSGIPVIIVDRDIKNIQLDKVFFQDEIGSYEAVKCLVNEGHKDIAIIIGPQTIRPVQERLAGYYSALESGDIAVNKDYIVDGYSRVDGGYNAAKKLMELTKPPTAIFATNNLMTLGCLKYLREKQIKMGKDIALVGCDELEELAYAGYNITTVERPAVKMGEETVNLMNRRFNEDKTIDKIYNQVIIGTNLILRGSEKIDIGGIYER